MCKSISAMRKTSFLNNNLSSSHSHVSNEHKPQSLIIHSVYHKLWPFLHSTEFMEVDEF